jgi:hypothetical protein
VIGVDFDNTIVCYDEVFGRIAVEQGLVPPEAATSKTAIRDHLRAAGAEDRWTELQGVIYGPRMMDAPPFPGVFEFFSACRAAGLPVAIISHRTRFPYLGERHDLHAAARDWLARHGFHDSAGIGLPIERVFFEETKEAKLLRIGEVNCTHFIDDLPELLAHPLFPRHVRRILFDPHGQHGSPAGITSAASWPHISSLLPAVGAPVRTTQSIAPLCAAADLPPPLTLERLPSGGNNRVYRVETATGPVLLKEYFRHPSDPRDRLAAEQAFSRFARSHGILAIPQPLACDRDAGLALYEFIAGSKLAPGEVTEAYIDEAADFIAAVNRHRDDPTAAELPTASEACFSIAEHLACVEWRIERLSGIPPESDLHREAIGIFASRLQPLWNRIRAGVIATVGAAGESIKDTTPLRERVVSPSDFGFHNCLVTDAGALRFFDFEYAGWDDSTKMVCDFFCQPEVPVPLQFLPAFVERITTAAGAADGLAGRVRLLMPVYGVKWCCIMLNEFLPVGDVRRTFAHTKGSPEDRQIKQLRKVVAALTRLEA